MNMNARHGNISIRWQVLDWICLSTNTLVLVYTTICVRALTLKVVGAIVRITQNVKALDLHHSTRAVQVTALICCRIRTTMITTKEHDTMTSQALSNDDECSETDRCVPWSIRGSWRWGRYLQYSHNGSYDWKKCLKTSWNEMRLDNACYCNSPPNTWQRHYFVCGTKWQIRSSTYSILLIAKTDRHLKKSTTAWHKGMHWHLWIWCGTPVSICVRWLMTKQTYSTILSSSLMLLVTHSSHWNIHEYCL